MMTEMKHVASFESAKDAYEHLCSKTGKGTVLTNGDWAGVYGPSIKDTGSFFIGGSADGHGNYSYDSGNGYIEQGLDGLWQVFVPVPVIVPEPEWVLVNSFDDVSSNTLQDTLYRVADHLRYFYIDQYNLGDQELAYDKTNHRYRIEDGKILVEKKQ
jgi:hypothetical protein